MLRLISIAGLAFAGLAFTCLAATRAVATADDHPPEGSLRISVFQVDATPPLGSPVAA